MVSRQPAWGKKLPRIDWRWFHDSQLGPRRSKDRLKTAKLAKKIPRIDQRWFQAASLDQEGPIG